MNDNGTGVATLLVLAERLAESPVPYRTIRLAFWGAEEGGPFGSQVYVDRLAPAQRERIVAYLNFDMLGSPNFIRFVYAEAGAATGSAELTEPVRCLLRGSGTGMGADRPHRPRRPRSLQVRGHPHRWAVQRRSRAQDRCAGRRLRRDRRRARDSCSDVACDTIDNVNDVILDQMADAVALLVATLAASPAPW